MRRARGWATIGVALALSGLATPSLVSTAVAATGPAATGPTATGAAATGPAARTAASDRAVTRGIDAVRAASTDLPPVARASARNVVLIDFDDLSGVDGQPVTEIRVRGTADATAAVATLGGGAILTATGRPSYGRAVSYPSFDPAPEAPRAVIRVLDETGRDNLSPKKRDFSFGADFLLDAVTSEPGSADDGDNLVQRGLYDDPAQYKLQVDTRYPSCRLKGTIKGVPAEVEVRSSVEVDDTHWYRATCVRDGRRLEVVVERYDDDGTSTSTTDKVRSDRAIKVVMEPRTVPLSVGGKLYADGTVDVDSDQFNGLVDEACLQVG